MLFCEGGGQMLCWTLPGLGGLVPGLGQTLHDSLRGQLHLGEVTNNHKQDQEVMTVDFVALKC